MAHLVRRITFGIARDNAFPSMTAEEWDSVIHTNLDAFYNVLNPLTMPLVRRRKPGRIVTLSSVSGLMGNRGQVHTEATGWDGQPASATLTLPPLSVLWLVPDS